DTSTWSEHFFVRLALRFDAAASVRDGAAATAASGASSPADSSEVGIRTGNKKRKRALLLSKGTIIITILITKIQAAARGLNTRTSLNNFFKACPPSGRTADLFLSRVYGGHEGGRRRGGGYVVDFIYCLRSTSLPLPFSEALARFPLEIYNPYGTAAALGRYRLVNAWYYPRGDWYTFYWDGSTADKVARRATYPTLEHDDHDPGPLAERIRRDKREFSIFGAERIRRDKREFSGRSSDDSSSDRDSCGTGSTSEANDIFDTLEDHLGYGSDSGSGW
ncbi:hypothetical protein EMIHUDRAFT_123114, partial [Emiliania huxleyi CCMP1516]|uniref:Uncharacterized protein n=2 Tax=Emiliania huxleyi TaxID=2903 RepID=A0A0D3K4S2_EMIH1